MADSTKTTQAATPKPFAGPYLREAYCHVCSGMVNGNGCGGYKAADGTPMPCPVSGQLPS